MQTFLERLKSTGSTDPAGVQRDGHVSDFALLDAFFSESTAGPTIVNFPHPDTKKCVCRREAVNQMLRKLF